MSHSSILGGDRAPQQAPGRDADTLGPSDSSDSGSDVQGATRLKTEPEEGEETGGATPVVEDSDSDAGSVKRTKVAQVFGVVGKKMLFLFDYGDEWRFQVALTALGEKAAKVRYPRMLSSTGEAPPQYPDFDEDEA